jgi:predicted metal-dependent enzyme (double-stranded beta helix superfamily)
MTLAERPSLDGVIEVPDCRLEPETLADLVTTIMRRDEAWRPHVRHDPDQRHYISLHESEHLGVWLICWMPGQDTGWHDHARSHGAFVVAEGVLREDRPVWGRAPRRTRNEAGATQCFDTTEIHRMCCLEVPSASIHAYSDPLKSMGMYRLEPDGYIRRRDVEWDERLTD